MSRSYKKHPYYTDGSAGTTKRRKNTANKKVRKSDDIPNGSGYKKVFESWEIHDYFNRWTWAEAKKFYESGGNEFLLKRYPTLKEFFNYWMKCCRRK